MKTLGITALVPPELVFACGYKPLDVNNIVPGSQAKPGNKLCAWTATWRDALLRGRLHIDALVVVAGGDCHNALVDGQRAGKHVPTSYFFYPFNGDETYLQTQLEELTRFLGGIKQPDMMHSISRIKKKLLQIDALRCRGKIPPETAFHCLISGSDLKSDPQGFHREIQEVLNQADHTVEGHRIALLGVPPIYHDFHAEAGKLGLHIVFDELPFEFLRHSGENINEIARSYARYTFARELEYRFKLLQRELRRRRVEAVIHYTQFACHHMLEDEMLREYLDYPVLTVQGDLPGRTPEQLKLRLEAFSEMLWRQP